MTHLQKVSLFLLRVGLGWLFFYAGITKVLDPAWSAAGYLNSAKTFSALYQFLASPGMLGLTNFVNEWGLTLIGVMMILGFKTRWAAWAGALMMILYYFPTLVFPKPNEHSFIVDEHIIYALGFATLALADAGRFWGLDGRNSKKK